MNWTIFQGINCILKDRSFLNDKSELVYCNDNFAPRIFSKTLDFAKVLDALLAIDYIYFFFIFSSHATDPNKHDNPFNQNALKDSRPKSEWKDRELPVSPITAY